MAGPLPPGAAVCGRCSLSGKRVVAKWTIVVSMNDGTRFNVYCCDACKSHELQVFRVGVGRIWGTVASLEVTAR
jgi:hypothetical protein